jgi:polyphenol oxidase
MSQDKLREQLARRSLERRLGIEPSIHFRRNRMIVQSEKFTIYFGDSQDNIHKTLDCIPSEILLIEHRKFASISKKIGVKHLALLNQIHGNEGIIVEDHIPAFEIDGDYLITAKPHVGIGVLTADCLPIAIYDQKNHIAAMIHAGWRGTIGAIVQKAINQLCQEFGAAKEEMRIFFGPSAKTCCYEVGADFLQHLQSFSYAHSVIQKVGNKLYLNVPELNILQIQEIGILRSKISQDYNFCTICDDRFYSHRRQGQAAGRQMSIITLRDARFASSSG